MAELDDKIKYSDLVSPDDSIKQLIGQLNALDASYGQFVETLKSSAKDMVTAMKSVNSATSEGRRQIDEMSWAAVRLERAERELKFAMSDTGKEVAWLKAQTSSFNKMTVEQRRQSEALIGSYDKLKLQLKEQISLWKALSETERQDSAIGGQVLDNVMALKAKLSTLDGQLKLHVEQISAVQKAEQKLAYLRSEEGQRLIELKRQINELVNSKNRDKDSTAELAEAQERLNKARSATNLAVQELNSQTSQANKITKLTAQINTSAEGSFDRIAAQYELNRIKLNAMSREERESTEAGKRLAQQTRELHAEMVTLQETVGGHQRLYVREYKKTWDGLGMATNQVIRELPALTMGANTFFLAISNNIPILVDEINQLQLANKAARAEGKAVTSVMGKIVKSIFSWQTALVILLTYLSMHGKEVIDWVSKILKGSDATMTASERLKAMQEELKTTNASYGQNIVTLRQLQQEWQNLASKKEQIQWIRDNKTEFDKLGISITGVTSAENAFVDNTAAVIEALKLRAKAAAAQQLAAKKYEEALVKRNEAETEKAIGVTASDKLANWFVQTTLRGEATAATVETAGKISPEDFYETRVDKLERESKAAEKDADAYFDLAAAYEAEAKSKLKSANVEEKTKGPKKEPKGREPRDLTDQIYRNQIELHKKYEMSITALQHDEYAKRRKEVIDTAMTETDKLKDKYRKNEEYVKNVDGKYKQLTDDQKKQIEQQQEWILSTLMNIQEKLNFDLQQIEKERQINSLKIMRETIDWQLEDIADSIEEEKKLKLEQLKQEEILAKTTNSLLEEGGRSEAEITAEYQNKRMKIIAEYDRQILNMRKANIDAQLEAVIKGTKQELKLLLQQNELARQMAIAENRAKPAAEQQSESQINETYAVKAQTITGSFMLTGFDEAQAEARAIFNIVKHNQAEVTKFTLQQEKDRWEKQLELAKVGALNWSDAQIGEAKATIKKLEREIEEVDDWINLIGEQGVGGALLTKLGFDDKQISALQDAANIILEQIRTIIQAEVDAAQQAVDAAKERVDAAQSAYEAEIEARANGYANSVATAKKELQLEKKNQREKEKILESAKRRQEAVNTVVQASSLVTASANLWSAFSSIPIVGPILAMAAIATMWTSFAAAKIKAAQVAGTANQEYGEGGLEFLEGGSHASGSDIDLQTRNSHGRNMRAEGGEALAVINRRSTRKYKRQLPGIIDALNRGTFEDKYLKAFERGETLQAQIIAGNSTSVDLSRIERSIDAIRKQNEQQFTSLTDGTVVEIKGNVTRYYK